MKTSMKKKMMKNMAKAAFAIGKTTAMSISRLGAYEPSADEAANQAIRERKN